MPLSLIAVNTNRSRSGRVPAIHTIFMKNILTFMILFRFLWNICSSSNSHSRSQLESDAWKWLFSSFSFFFLNFSFDFFYIPPKWPTPFNFGPIQEFFIDWPTDFSHCFITRAFVIGKQYGVPLSIDYAIFLLCFSHFFSLFLKRLINFRSKFRCLIT